MGDRGAALAALFALCHGCTVALDWDRSQLGAGDGAASVDAAHDAATDADAAHDAAHDAAVDAPCATPCAAPMVCVNGACACPAGTRACDATGVCRECCAHTDCAGGRCCSGVCCRGMGCAGCTP